MKPGLWDYVRAAFSARPIGMFIPPNWIGLGLFAILGLISPGFILLGAGLELGYLYALSTHPRFQRLVDALGLLKAQREWQKKLDAAVARLGPADRQRFGALQDRCRSILQQQGGEPGAALMAQGDSLGRLMWIYLTLLTTRQSISRVLGDAVDDGGRTVLESRVAKLQDRLKADHLAEELQRSLTSQVDILQQRLQKQREAADKVAFLDAELARIQEQVELIREQGVLATDPDTVSQRIDQVSATLGGTAQWLREQQQLYGKVEDLLVEPPPVSIPASAAQQQQEKQ
jgi:hypothetical protein